MDKKKRCPWPGDTPIYIDYHDNEWGRPTHDDRELFEMLVLESMQAGLSWITVLKKREAFREAFDGFDPEKVALYDDEKIEELMNNEKIIRNRRKITAAVNNAKLFLKVQEEYGSFDKFIWKYVDNTPIIGHWEKIEDMPASTPLSDRISKDLKKMGFQFLGTTIIYSFMQSVGMVNDHIKECFVYQETVGRKRMQ
ncbi:MAG: DNA-3-methyladenine glycosylase I [Faecalicatena sp.]|uniref:DNA-3-methyladenine glycosylase I n=1 Tax=Faecalicatena sp. TaxID=2005360 RepID=UPI0025880AA4|nr:DNA-3-methyladenine glycosylase I [Faecalicatena sp.]MCI6465762.1 DNA-3-methyladenine glycosylase I [Faecalicatena sp.]MDY5618824.1 DNA-3-methyladenine glycosylase I [Lachnospiraceae bacterium]